MRALSILFTNNMLSARYGSELWVLDVCRALVSRGHRPIAFSLVTGAVAAELRTATVPVVERLDDLGFTPDLIHGHHHIETLIAALHFPTVPIVHFCHGWLPPEERPLLHPSIVRYVAVDETCADRLTAENGISRDRVDLLLNFVDMKRFLPRAPLPTRPRRALVFNNEAGEHGYVAVIREACREQGIELDLVGIHSGHGVARPQDLLGGYDLVFARARAALEAMAVGCSVILAGNVGCGPLVTEQHFDRMRHANFGVRWLQQPHSVDWYRAQIAAYDSAEAGRIARRIREEADLELAVDRLLDIYQRTLAGHQSPAPATTDPFAEAQRAASRHLASVAVQFKHAHQAEARSTRLAAELAAAHAAREHVAHERELLLARVAALAADLTAAGDLNQRLIDEVTTARDLNQQLIDQVAAERRRHQHAADEIIGLESRHHRLAEEAVAARNRNRRLEEEAVAARDCNQRLEQEAAVACARNSQLAEEAAAAHHRNQQLAGDAADLRELNQQLRHERDALAQLVAAYRALPILRLRDRLMRIPVLGRLAQRSARSAARWIGRGI